MWSWIVLYTIDNLECGTTIPNLMNYWYVNHVFIFRNRFYLKGFHLWVLKYHSLILFFRYLITWDFQQECNLVNPLLYVTFPLFLSLGVLLKIPNPYALIAGLLLKCFVVGEGLQLYLWSLSFIVFAARDLGWEGDLISLCALLYCWKLFNHMRIFLFDN